MILLSSAGPCKNGEPVTLDANQKVAVLEAVLQAPYVIQILEALLPASAKPFGLAEMLAVDAPDLVDTPDQRGTIIVGGLIVIKLRRDDTGAIVEFVLTDEDAVSLVSQVSVFIPKPIARKSIS